MVHADAVDGDRRQGLNTTIQIQLRRGSRRETLAMSWRGRARLSLCLELYFLTLVLYCLLFTICPFSPITLLYDSSTRRVSALLFDLVSRDGDPMPRPVLLPPPTLLFAL